MLNMADLSSELARRVPNKYNVEKSKGWRVSAGKYEGRFHAHLVLKHGHITTLIEVVKIMSGPKSSDHIRPLRFFGSSTNFRGCGNVACCKLSFREKRAAGTYEP